MFGYVTANKPELKMKDFYKYKAYYCGLCSVLRERYGVRGQMTLTYDMTFLVILLTSLYEPDTAHEKKRCAVHPVKRHEILRNEVSAYAADMNIVLAYHHFADDWKDDRSKAGLAGLHTYRNLYLEVQKKYPEKCRVIQSCLARLHRYERAGETNVDAVSACFGSLMAELFAYREDVWTKTLRKMGFYLGKYIYILDAFDDLEEDVREGKYNPLVTLAEGGEYSDKCRQMLTLVLAECSRYFEMLPCVEDAEILRNILYAGVWSKFEKKQLEKEKEKSEGKNYDSRTI